MYKFIHSLIHFLLLFVIFNIILLLLLSLLSILFYVYHIWHYLREFVFSKLPSSWTRARVKGGLSAPHLRRLIGHRWQAGRAGGSPVLLWYFMCKMALFGTLCLFWIPSSLILSVLDTELVKSAPILRPDAPPLAGGSPGDIRGIPGTPYPQDYDREFTPADLPPERVLYQKHEDKGSRTGPGNPPRARPGHPGVRNASFP